MRPPAALRRLETAAELRLDRERQALRRADDAIAALRAEAEALRGLRADGAAELAMRGAAAAFAGSWEALRARRLHRIAVEMAERAAERDEARARVARASGRVIAIRKLASREKG